MAQVHHMGYPEYQTETHSQQRECSTKQQPAHNTLNKLIYGYDLQGLSPKTVFTPLESPSIYAADIRNKEHQLLREGRVKALPFLTGFTSLC